MSLELKRFLFEAYGGFGDKRIKKLEKGDTFTIDGRKRDEHDGRGNLNGSFCRMFARVSGEDEIVLSLHEKAPLNDRVVKLVKARGGEAGEHVGTTHLSVRLTPADAAFIRELSSAIRAIVAPGTPRYGLPDVYKKICPQVAAALDRLAALLAKYAATHPPAPKPLPSANGDASTRLPALPAPAIAAVPANFNSAALDQQIARLSDLIQHAEGVLTSISTAARSGGRRRMTAPARNAMNEAQNKVLREIFKANVELMRTLDNGSAVSQSQPNQ